MGTFVGESSSNNGGVNWESVCGIDWIKRDEPPYVDSEWPVVSVIDLFCGCGGMSLGLREALRREQFCMRVNLAVDIMAEATDVYRKALGCGDAATVGDVLDLFGDDDRISKLEGTNVVLAGPPCQGHSDLNNHTRRNDRRNSLYEKTAVFAARLDPDLIIIENVPGARHDSGCAVQNAENHLRDAGYQTHTVLLQANEYGIPQTRRRLFLVATRFEVSVAELVRYMGEPAQELRPFIEDIADEHDRSNSSKFRKASRMSETNKWRAAWLVKNDEKWLDDELRPPCHRGKDHSYKSVYGRLSYDEPAQTITTGFGSMGQGRYLHPEPPIDDLRVITPHEAARIQGLPDFIGPIFDDVRTRGALHGMIGNAVPPKLVGVLIENLIAAGVEFSDVQEQERVKVDEPQAAE